MESLRRLMSMESTKTFIYIIRLLDSNKKNRSAQKKRGARANNKGEKKPCPQEDSSDLKCQLHFAKEESALMCKKLTKLVKESEAMKEELSKFRSMYGDVDASLTVEEVADSPHTREAEVRVHLKLVEEEANLLSRRIVELEVENRGLRAEMDDMKSPQDISPDLPGSLSPDSASGRGHASRGRSFFRKRDGATAPPAVRGGGGGAFTPLSDGLEEQNKLLMNEINRYKSELPPSLSSNSLASLTDGLLNDSPVHSIQEGAVLINVNAPSQEEELRLARLQIGELSGKVKKLQYENRVLLSNLQRCDLASYNAASSSASSTLRLNLETDAEAGDSAECLPSPPSRREPVGGETDPSDLKEHKRRFEDSADSTHSLPVPLVQKDHDALLSMRDQARLVSTAIQLLISPESSCLQSPSIYHKVCTNESKEEAANQEEAEESCDQDKSQSNNSQISELSDLSDRPLVGALTSRLQALHSQLQAFVERVDGLSRAPHSGAGLGGVITPEDSSLVANIISSEENSAAHKPFILPSILLFFLFSTLSFSSLTKIFFLYILFFVL
ncbi:hypothetical protein WMY93_027770 [Mugilogobius chulae]|uniref:SOGA coiled-coil domain-containing protein n=1 Tax=Mugilogobius chulae TaxID=88201 RepID=A0AAW0MY82_9GOBI